MELYKAVEILEFHSEWLQPSKDHDLKDAMKLGIEALREKLAREERRAP